MGALRIHIPSISDWLNVLNIALGGKPFLAGFYSKDIILEEVRIRNINIFKFFYIFFPLV